MIRGIGVDIVECRRMEGREKRFYERFLSDDELMEQSEVFSLPSGRFLIVEG